MKRIRESKGRGWKMQRITERKRSGRVMRDARARREADPSPRNPAPTSLAPAPLFVASLVLASCGTGERPRDAEAPPVEGAVEVTLAAQVPERGSDRWLMWSPYGRQIPLTEGEGAMTGELLLGPEGTAPIRLHLGRSPGAEHFDELRIDLDRDGVFEPEELLTATPAERNYRFWSSFDAVVEVPVTDPVTGEESTNPYPLGFWYVEDPRVPEEEPVIRYSRHGYMEGRVVLDGVEAAVLVTEGVMDGVFGAEDSWALASVDSAADILRPQHSATMEEHLWLFDEAYRVVEVDASGRRLVLAPFDPGITREEEAAMKDDLKVDREAPRSGRAVAFRRGFEAAEAEARAAGRRLFIDFETTWCGPCKIMDEWVYTADAVVDAAVGVVSVKVDGDERLDLKERFGVSGFPTLILLGPEGGEIRRASGYVNVADMTEFLTGDALTGR